MTDELRESSLQNLAVLKAAREKVTSDQAALAQRLADIDAAIEAINTVLASSDGAGEDNLADTVRNVLRRLRKPLTPVQVRGFAGTFYNYDFTRHPNPMAAVHGVLKRLAESGEVHNLGGKAYLWKEPAKAPLSNNPLKGFFKINTKSEGDDK